MAFRSLFVKNRPPLHPEDFYKPPLYTYAGHFLARVPAMALSTPFLLAGKEKRDEMFFRIRLSLMRIFNLCLFAGTVVLAFKMISDAFGLFPARSLAWLFATSAGFIPYQIYLTSDLALTFTILLSLSLAYAVSRSPGNWVSFFAGLAVGLATATKYNGLAAAIALPLAHAMAPDPNGATAFLKRKSTWLSAFAIPIGFLIGNPYALINFKKFFADFYYNYETTPVYGGQIGGSGYTRFFELFGEIYGWPASFTLLLLVAASFAFFLEKSPLPKNPPRLSSAAKLWILSAAIFAFYTWKIGAFPRMTTRFVLPVAPLLLLLAAAGFASLSRHKKILFSLFASLVAYNLVCGFYVGRLFRLDPRMLLLPAISSEAKTSDQKTTAEASKSLPAIDLQTSKKILVKKMPKGLKRAESFEKIFAENQTLMAMKDRWQTEFDTSWFSQEQRSLRNPDWIVWSSVDLEDAVKPHYEALFLPSSGYRVIFDAASPPLPDWVYPQHPDFLLNRTTFWKKSS